MGGNGCWWFCKPVSAIDTYSRAIDCQDYCRETRLQDVIVEVDEQEHRRPAALSKSISIGVNRSLNNNVTPQRDITRRVQSLANSACASHPP